MNTISSSPSMTLATSNLMISPPSSIPSPLPPPPGSGNSASLVVATRLDNKQQQQQQQQQEQQQKQQQQQASSSGISLSTKDVSNKKRKTTEANAASMMNQVSATQCSNCGTTTTPLWRRAPNGDTICNACGLYLKARHTLRPPTLKRNHTKKQPSDDNNNGCKHGDDSGSGGNNDNGNGTGSNNGNGLPSGSCPGGGKCNGTGGSSSCAGCPAFNQHQVNRHALICANCRTTTTPLWRRDGGGNTICNACGLYYKLHNVHRPVSMKRSVIKRRKRLIVTNGMSNASGDEDDGEVEEEHIDQLAQEDDDEQFQQQQRHQHQQQQQQQQLENQQKEMELANQVSQPTKKVRKPYRKRVKAQQGGQQDAADQHPLKGKRSRVTLLNHSTSPASTSSSPVSTVPAIEDYIVPRRSVFSPMPTINTASSSSSPMLLANSRSSSLSPSLPAIPHPDYNHHHHHLHQQQQQQQQSLQHHHQQLSPSSINSTKEAFTNESRHVYQHTARSRDDHSSSVSLPPISSERRSAHFDPFYREGRPSTTSPSLSNAPLPPISLPPLRPTAAAATTPGTVATASATKSNNVSNTATSTVPALNGTSIPASSSSSSSSPPSIHHPSPVHPSNSNNSNMSVSSSPKSPTSSNDALPSAFMSAPPPPMPSSSSPVVVSNGNNDHFSYYNHPHPHQHQHQQTRQHQQQQQQQQQLQLQQQPNYIELEELDEALKTLQTLRRKVQPEQVRALAQLSKPLWDMVSKAQSIVHGTGALSHPP